MRNYRSDDLKNVKEILFEYPSPTGRVWSGDMVEEILSDALREQPDGVSIAKISGKVGGFAIVIYRDWFNIAYLDYIQVKTEWINKGVGHRLVEKCMNWAREKGARIIYTETGKDNERAIKFYQKHGFQVTDHIPDYNQNGSDAVILVSKIASSHEEIKRRYI